MNYKVFTGRHDVHQATIYFNKPEKKDYVGDWTPEWNEMLGDLQKIVNMLLQSGFGILDVNIRKTEPESGVIFVVEITYWDNP